MNDSNDNFLSYENINPESKTQVECTGFTQINNNVINNIKNGDAFLVWCYLYSKTANWKAIKSNIKNVYGFGDAKLKKIFSYLRRCNLIEYVQNKDDNGQFCHVTIRILNGSRFNKNEPYCTTSPVGQKPTPAVKRTNGNDELLNTNITKQIKEHNKPPIVPQGDAVRFEEFWDIYPIKKSKDACKKKWKSMNLDEIADEILHKLDIQKMNDRTWLDGYIPHALTYINQKRWEDEVDVRPRGKTSKQQSADSFHTTMSKYKNVLNSNGYYDEHGNYVKSYL